MTHKGKPARHVGFSAQASRSAAAGFVAVRWGRPLRVGFTILSRNEWMIGAAGCRLAGMFE
jgi:hypothetical protein